MDDDLWPVTIDQWAKGIGPVEVERHALPRDRTEWTRKRRVLERADYRPPEPPAGTRHRDSHGYASVDAASLAPYWRS